MTEKEKWLLDLAIQCVEEAGEGIEFDELVEDEFLTKFYGMEPYPQSGFFGYTAEQWAAASEDEQNDLEDREADLEDQWDERRFELLDQAHTDVLEFLKKLKE